ncbi:MAG TPA: hypothetical protein VFU47_16220 [Armatimonadota bacterium]|nr:hypothetical protein [Armatimonadota bacterium]
MLTTLELLSHLRERIGDPGLDEVPQHELVGFLTSAFDWAAQRWRNVIVTADRSLALAAGVQEYPLPGDLLYVTWAEWNGSKLPAASTFQWERDGTDWRGTAAGNPREFAVQGRKLILWPKPSAGAVETDGFLTFRFVGAAGEPRSAASHFSDADLWVILYHAAVEWLGANPGADELEMKRRQLMLQTAREQLALRLADADARHQEPVEDHYPAFTVKTRRRGAAR